MLTEQLLPLARRAEIVRYLSRYAEPGRARRVVLIGATAPRIPAGPDYPRGFDPAAMSAVEAEWRTDFVRWIDENKRAFFAPDTSNGLVDCGELDSVVPVSFAAHTAELMPNARLKCYPGAAHGVFITHAPQVHGFLLEFIRGGEGKETP